MSSTGEIRIHPSQSPEQVRRDLLESLRVRRLNHKFLYASPTQARKWLALHQAYSPSRTDADCAAIYDASFSAVAPKIAAPSVHLIGLGCGGGQKDARLLRQLRQAGKRIAYTPTDVSPTIALAARDEVLRTVPGTLCDPLACDLATAADLPALLNPEPAAGTAKLLTFFGMIPNFEPELILPCLASLVRPDDCLLFSANLAPGENYDAGIQRVLPLYDNELTCDWLLAFLFELGVKAEDGELRFSIEEHPAGSGLKRIEANYHFHNTRHVEVEGETIQFNAGETIRLFFSYRHTPEKVRALLAPYNLGVIEEWVAPSGEEGVFLCRKTGAH